MVLQVVLPAIGIGVAIVAALAFGVPILTFIAWMFTHPFVVLGIFVSIAVILFMVKK